MAAPETLGGPGEVSCSLIDTSTDKAVLTAGSAVEEPASSFFTGKVG